MTEKIQVRCPNCLGKGTVEGDGFIFHKCTVCDGKKYIEEVKEEPKIQEETISIPSSGDVVELEPLKKRGRKKKNER